MRRVPSPRLAPLSLAAVVFLGALLAAWSPGSPGALETDDSASTRLLRFPTLSRDSIAFVYGGDIWTVARGGGMARQITSDPGLELMPRYSPDGKWIAFTGQYDGNRDVYVLPAEGGVPRRLTFWMDTGHPAERAGPNNYGRRLDPRRRADPVPLPTPGLGGSRGTALHGRSRRRAA